MLAGYRGFALAWTIVTVTILLGPGSAHAQTFARKDFAQLVGEAEQIFVGPVAAATARRLPSGLIVTDVTFAPVRGLKGTVGAAVVLEVVGGTAEGVTLRLAGVPSFEVGRHYVVFSKENGRAVFPVVGGDQGLFQVEVDPATGVAVVRDATGRGVTSALMGYSAATRAPSVGPMELEVFIREIEAWVAR